MRVPILFLRTPSSWLNHEAPPPTPTHWGIGFQLWIWGSHGHSVYELLPVSLTYQMEKVIEPHLIASLSWKVIEMVFTKQAWFQAHTLSLDLCRWQMDNKYFHCHFLSWLSLFLWSLIFILTVFIQQISAPWSFIYCLSLNYDQAFWISKSEKKINGTSTVRHSQRNLDVWDLFSLLPRRWKEHVKKKKVSLTRAQKIGHVLKEGEGWGLETSGRCPAQDADRSYLGKERV